MPLQRQIPVHRVTEESVTRLPDWPKPRKKIIQCPITFNSTVSNLIFSSLNDHHLIVIRVWPTGIFLLYYFFLLFSANNAKSEQERNATAAINMMIPTSSEKHKHASAPHTPHTPHASQTSSDHSSVAYSIEDSNVSRTNEASQKGPFMLAPTPAQLGRAPLQRRQSLGKIYLITCDQSW